MTDNKKQGTSAPVTEFTKFSKDLDQALQKEELRRKELQKSESIITQYPGRGLCTSFKDTVIPQEPASQTPTHRVALEDKISSGDLKQLPKISTEFDRVSGQ